MEWRETAYSEESWQASASQLSRLTHNFNVEAQNSSCYASGARLTLRPAAILVMPPRNQSRGPQSGRNNSRNNFGPRKRVEPDSDDKAVEVEGEISSVLAGTMFRVKLASGHEVLAHISGKMRKRFIRLVVGDRVKMEMSPYDLSKARIVFRLG